MNDVTKPDAEIMDGKDCYRLFRAVRPSNVPSELVFDRVMVEYEHTNTDDFAFHYVGGVLKVSRIVQKMRFTQGTQKDAFIRDDLEDVDADTEARLRPIYDRLLRTGGFRQPIVDR